MGQPRASRRKAVTVSSDDEDAPEAAAVTTVSSDDDKPVLKPQKRSIGKLKPVSKAKEAQQPTPPTTTQDGSSQ